VNVVSVLPATIQGIRRYLGSGLIKGIGPKMAERIVDHFGEATLGVIEETPGRLVEVAGLDPGGQFCDGSYEYGLGGVSMEPCGV
jgi:exodeoxyribonuclease V alpha subunit